MRTTQRSRPVPGDGASLKEAPDPAQAITRVDVRYAIKDAFGTADVGFCYPLGTRIIMADGKVLPVEWLKSGMRFRLEDGGVATATHVEEPKVWEPPSQKKDASGNSLRRVIGTVKYSGHFPRIDIGVAGEILKTTPGHLFWSVTRRSWQEAHTFRIGELLRNRRGRPVPVDSISPVRMEFCELHNLEVEEHHTYFVGQGGIWTHNGMEMGCRVPRAAEANKAVAEAIEDGTLSVRKIRNAGDVHHIASDKDAFYGPRFAKLFEEAGLNLQSAWNRTRVPGHVGPHGKFYNGIVLERLRIAVTGRSGNAYRTALLDELYQLRREIQNGDLGDLLRAGASKDDVMRNFQD